ncbi:MAG: peroxiredoxin [Actinomycetia bacterium]|nr:peroxiredoxin [Actinomycetes bacterium]
MSVEVGQEAADFTLSSQHGEPISLSSFRGEKKVVLIFFPWAFSGICTGELCEISERLESFDNDETVTLAVSCDQKFALRIFGEREGYTFQLLSDHWPHGAVTQAYGVFNDDLGVGYRGTFIIDKAGVIRYSVINGIGDARDPAEYEKVLASLG